jgi:hypothetical protein
MTAKSGFGATPESRHAVQEHLADQIRANWKETLEGIVQTGNWLIEGGFRKADYELHQLPFCYSWGRKLIKIARCPRILDPENRPRLPDKAAALHEIALLSDRLWGIGVSEGVINCRCLVVDVKQFRQSFVTPGRSKTRRISTVYECSPDRDQSAMDMLDDFVAAVQKMADTHFPAINVRPPRRAKELVPS